jgi:crossover junction endodeoxyribonuclease RuvC
MMSDLEATDPAGRDGRRCRLSVRGPSGASLRAVGFDPGLADTGYAAVDAQPGALAVLETGVIRTRAREPLEDRLEHLFEGVREILDRLTPDLIVIEDVFSAPGAPRTAILMGHARAVICLAARQRRVRLLSVTPAEVKRAVTASGAASKGQVARAMQSLLGLPTLPRPSHVADGLALAFTGLSRARGLERTGAGGLRSPA